MTNLSIFYVVFMAQILLLSVYFPVKLIKRMKFIHKEYPARTHPKLYPKSTNFYKKSINMYSTLNALIFIVGCVVVYFIYEGSLVGEKGVNLMLPWFYFMLQMIPTWLLEIFGFKMSKLMKLEDTRTKKSAQLEPRNLLQYISPYLLLTVILAYVGFATFAFYLEGFEFDIEGKAFLMCLILLMGYVFFFVLMAWLIYGKKQDPYQSSKDRIKAVSMVIKTYCYTMIICAFFLAFTLAVISLGLKSLMPVAMSFFLQFIVAISMGYMLANNRIEDIDFDVYKND
ncbi:MAG: hypothetical protein ACSHWU_07590 [Marinicella sp.]